ncbi:MAG: uroporphyrinogen-III synthase [Pseudomonadota bacterium]|nr:uroporphyrinogen-III synthase [Xanthomonadaceae bacterium]MDE3210747.1 uroporphyrinogen-III synthase [Pseudomonadota bacterium]
MQRKPVNEQPSLRGRMVVITRPAGTAAGLARSVRTRGGQPLLLPGLALRAVADVVAARAALQLALGADLLIFSSPAAVRHAAALLPLRTGARVLAVGQGTATALRRHGIAEPLVPPRQDSEGLLGLAALRDLRGRDVVLIGAAGGRGLLRRQLVERGARLREVHVYRRLPPRLDRRHFEPLRQLPASARVLLSSAEALQHLCRLLPAPALARLCAATAVVSSERLAEAARQAGFVHVIQASSALGADLLRAAARAD